MLDAAELPDDIAALKAMLIAAQAREVRKDERIERLEKMVAAFKQAAFAPASCSSSTAIIRSSVNLCFFIRSSFNGSDSSPLEEIRSSRSTSLQKHKYRVNI
ncbi:hypothetical protein ELG79_09080 [Rhizobium leguminosarum]|nr:hypothetical protein ELG79_09080 [Rhizobium leguminosarum]